MNTQQARLFAIVADVGGTHIRFATLINHDAPLECIQVFDCASFGQIEDALVRYLAYLRDSTPLVTDFKKLCLALPGDVQSDPVQLVNLAWTIYPDRLSRQFDCEVSILNDFSAQAHAIPEFQPTELEWLRPPCGDPMGLNRAVVGPGTGLGVAALLPDGAVVESEGGHISFAPQSPLQQQLLTTLWTLFPRISAERLISGPGLANIYQGLALMAGQDKQLKPEQITGGAAAGDAECQAAVNMFTQLFGSICGDLALAFSAKGGLFLSGGLLQGLDTLFDTTSFLSQFDAKGRYQQYCRQIPIARILSPQPGLIGAARFARRQLGV